MIRDLKLENVRCHGGILLEGLEKMNLFLGANGRGKTTLLEAIYLLGRCKSFRVAKTNELIHWGQESLRVEGKFKDEGDVETLGFLWGKGGRRLSVNGIENATLGEFWGSCSVVVLRNRDMALVQDQAGIRRKWMDGLIATAEKEYLTRVSRLAKVLRERNALLKQGRVNRGMWNALTEQLWTLSEEVTGKREEFTEEVKPVIQNALERITGQKEKVEFHYNSNFRKNEERSWEDLFRSEEKTGTTRVGPQRDEWEIELNGKSVRIFGSEGQQRSVTLAMRFAEIEVLKKKRGKCPVLLIDDVLHELDEERQKYFWELVPEEAQVFAAATRRDFVRKEEFTVWEIEPGAVRRGN